MDDKIWSRGVFLRQQGEHLQRVQSNEQSRAQSEAEPTDRPLRSQLRHQPRDSQHHDVLVVPPRGVLEPGEFYRFPVTKDQGEEEGQYRDLPEKIDSADWGQRKVLSAAFPQEHGPAKYRELGRGPAFSVLPIKPEPASTSCMACYLVVADNLNYPNPWTHGLWNSHAAEESERPMPGSASLEVLVAAGRGKVLKLQVPDLESWEPGAAPVELRRADGAVAATIEAIDLGRETEVWGQLRNGCVAGRVLLAEDGRVLPIVNITSLEKLDEPDESRH